VKIKVKKYYLPNENNSLWSTKPLILFTLFNATLMRISVDIGRFPSIITNMQIPLIRLPRIKQNNTKGLLFALAGTILVSTNYITAKYGLKGFNPYTFSMIWTIAAAFYSFIIIVLSGRVKDLLIPRHHVLRMVALGFTTGIGMILAWAGLALLDPSFSSFLWRFAPALTIIASYVVLREKMSVWEIFPLAIMLIGGAISTIGVWHVVGTGVVLTLLACVFVAIQMLVAKKSIADISANTLVFYRVAGAAVVITLYSLLIHKVEFSGDFSQWAASLAGAFLGPCCSFLFTFRSYRYWSLSRSSIVLTIQPLIVLPMAYIAFGRIPTVLQLIGGAIILAGALWLAKLHKSWE
jgi:drug/metabolite transporter (DMT)-like permease